jgi:hypothetical protein
MVAGENSSARFFREKMKQLPMMESDKTSMAGMMTIENVMV